MINFIVPVHDKQEFLEQLITTAEKFFHDGPPRKWYIVDNGSGLEMQRYLEKIRSSFVRVIRLSQNKGFAYACNAGMDAVLEDSHVRRIPTDGHVCFLNNDTVPSFGTFIHLERALMSRDDIGAAGPVSNCVSGPQQIYTGPIDFTSKKFMDDWVLQEICDKNANKRTEVDRLVGFCLLVKDGVWQKVGKFDENYGVGTWEDDDYCLRIRKLGYKLVIAHDSFLFHYGSQTLAALGYTGDKFNALMDKNQAYFESKWGLSRDAYHNGNGKDIVPMTPPLEEDGFVPRFVNPAPVDQMIQAPVNAVAPPKDPWEGSLRKPMQSSGLKNVTGVIIGIPNHKGELHRYVHASIGAMETMLVRSGITAREITMPCAALHEARQNLVDAVLASEPVFSHALFLDDDMTFGPDAIANLIADVETYDCDLVTNIAFINGIPTGPNIFGLRRDREEFGEQTWWDCMTVWPQDKLFEIAACGMSFCLVSRRMLKAMRDKAIAEGKPKDWCHFIYKELRSEDVAFCINARKAGFRLFCDARAKIGHIYREPTIIDRDTYKAQRGAAGMKLPEGQKQTGHCEGAGPFIEYRIPGSPTAVLPFKQEYYSSPTPETIFYNQLAPVAAGGG